MKGLANTLLSEQVCREGGGSLLEGWEPREGAGREDWQEVEDAGFWGCVVGEGCSGSSSPGSDSLSDSLEAEPDSSKKLRVFLAADASSPASFTQLEERKSERKRPRHFSLCKLARNYLQVFYNLCLC